MNILSISQNYFLSGGSDRVFFETKRLLEENGHTVIPFAARDARNLPDGNENYFPVAANFQHPRPVDIARYVYSFPAAQKIRQLLHAHQLDVAHLHIYYGKLTASILGPLRKAGVPIVQTLHEYKLVCPVYTLISNGEICEACLGGNYWKAMPRRCNRGSIARTTLSVLESYVSHALGAQDKIDHFIAVSDFMRNKMIAHGIPQEKISRIYNFVEASRVLPNKSHGEYFLYFGRIERIKGVLTLVEAFSSFKNLKLKIVGNGNDLEYLQQMTISRNLSHIEFVDFQTGEQLTDLIRNSLAVIVPSQWYETFGMTVIEAFSHSRPVIASDIGALPELITNGEDGFLVAPGDIEALREKIIRLAEYPEEALRMGLAGRQKVLMHFNSSRYLDELMRLYRSVIG